MKYRTQKASNELKAWNRPWKLRHLWLRCYCYLIQGVDCSWIGVHADTAELLLRRTAGC